VTAATERRRQTVHLACTGFVLLLPWLTIEQALVLAGAAIVLNWLVMPVLGWDAALRRDEDRLLDGVRTYPIAVLLSLLIFPSSGATVLPSGVGWPITEISL